MFKLIAKGAGIIFIVFLTVGSILPLIISSNILPMPVMAAILAILILGLTRFLMWFLV